MPIHFTPSTAAINDLTIHLERSNLPKEEQMEVRATLFPSEWFPQSGVQLTWPHDATDWAPLLTEVDDCFVRIAYQVLARQEKLLVVTPEPERIRPLLAQRLPARLLPGVRYFECPTNDTWARDHGFLTLVSPQGPIFLDFQFNGWGKKFNAILDNQINRNLVEQGVLNGQYEDHLDFVLEGGSIECDGRGTILTTSKCLLAPNRNQPLSQAEIEDRLKRYLRVERVLWLDYGYLAGDDTDSHIDTLARLCPNDTIAYVQCLDKDDEHYEELKKMEEQLQEFRTLEGKPYQLIPLPMAEATYDEDGMRLPATYANFLCINGAVLMPTYGCPRVDEQARQQLQQAFPKHEIVPVDCRILIEQHGSLHCSAMQFPVGVIKSEEVMK